MVEGASVILLLYIQRTSSAHLTINEASNSRKNNGCHVCMHIERSFPNRKTKNVSNFDSKLNFKMVQTYQDVSFAFKDTN